MMMMGSAHTINVQSVVFVLDEILPALRALGVAEEELVVHVIGPNMNHQPQLSQHREKEKLRLHGRVRGVQLDSLFNETKVFLSPAVSGLASFKTKNLEALARGLPVVTSRLAALGLERASGSGHTHTGVSIVASDPHQLAAAVAELLEEEALWRRASTGARAFAHAHFHPRNLELEVQALLAATGL